MSEAMTVPPLADAPAKRTPTVYFIDDSATMREVIKIAFRRESINIITCGDAAAALAQFAQNPPDAVITDVIMPDQDGYSVCTQIKQHPEFGSVPVILMSGVVNKTVADKAVAVKADELIRKPFQPQELIGRVKSLLNPKDSNAAPAPERPLNTNALSGLFAPAPVPVPQQPRQPVAVPPPPQTQESAWPRALAEAFVPRPPAPANPFGQQNTASHQPTNAGHPSGYPSPASQSPSRQPTTSDIQKLRVEIARLDLQIKKLQTELQIERQYNQALETQIRALTEVE
jgi:CheY-like chemotaxis protein